MSPRLAVRGAIGIGVSIAAAGLLLGTVDLAGAASRRTGLQPGYMGLPVTTAGDELACRTRAAA